MECVQILLECGANVNIRSTCSLGITPFHISFRNDLEVWMLLYPHVDDINVLDHSRQTPLHHAIEDGEVQAVQFLLSQINIDLVTKDRNGFSPLQYAKTLLLQSSIEDEDEKEKRYEIVTMIQRLQSYIYFKSIFCSDDNNNKKCHAEDDRGTTWHERMIGSNHYPKRARLCGPE
jgi:Ankyrin repeats (3 copies)